MEGKVSVIYAQHALLKKKKNFTSIQPQVYKKKKNLHLSNHVGLIGRQFCFT